MHSARSMAHRPCAQVFNPAADQRTRDSGGGGGHAFRRRIVPLAFDAPGKARARDLRLRPSVPTSGFTPPVTGCSSSWDCPLQT
jgi:hypothetical protein